jgi:CheY-like chemotaxis protein
MQRRALIVDDEERVCDFISGVLSANGLEAMTLTSSAKALTYLRTEKFSAAIIDLQMPAPDGLELTRIARDSGLNQKTPIIVVSDDQSPAAVSRAFSAGASFFLYKPIDKTRLLKLISATQGAIEHERRRFRRVALRSRVLLALDHLEWTGETLDVSLDGMLVAGPASLPTGSIVQVRLYLSPEMKPIVGLGSVVRVLGDGQMGIQLNRFTLTESERLQEYLLPLIFREGQRELAANTRHVV